MYLTLPSKQSQSMLWGQSGQVIIGIQYTRNQTLAGEDTNYSEPETKDYEAKNSPAYLIVNIITTHGVAP